MVPVRPSFSAGRSAYRVIAAALVGGCLAAVLSHVFVDVWFDPNAGPTSGALTDATHAALGVAVGVGVAAFLGALMLRGPYRLMGGVLAGVAAQLLVATPLLTLFDRGDLSVSDAVGLGLAGVGVLIAPITIAALLGAVAHGKR